MTDNIVKFEPLTRIAERIRAAYKRTQQGRWEWIEGTLELAAALADGRAKHTSDRAFSHWLVDEELDDIGHQDRAALIAMAANLTLARSILQDSQRISWQHIWNEEMQLRFTQVSKPESPPASLEIASVIAPVELKQTVSPTAPSEAEVHLQIKRNHPFFGFSRAEEIATIYSQSKTRMMIGNAIRKQRAIWPLILQVVDAGLLKSTNVIREQPDLSIILPNASLTFRRKYTLTKVNDLRVVKERVLPAILANRDTIAADPAGAEDVVNAYWRRLQQEANAEQQVRKIAAARAAMKDRETDVILFGRRFWPIIEVDHPELTYDYETLRHAVWTFRELHQVSRLGSDSSAQSCGVRIRHIIKFLTGYMDKKIMRLLHEMSRALQENPDGEERLPDMPNMDRPYD